MYLKRAITRRMRDDSGSTLLAVVGLMAVTAIIGVTVANVSLNALGFTSATRAGIQSQAAAQSGVNVALAALKSTATCTSTYTSTSTPKYSVQLSYATDATLTSSSVWTNGCPITSAKFVKIVSTGTATSIGVNRTSSGNTQRIEAIYEYTTSTTAITATGGASYSYQGGNVNNLTLFDGGNLNSDIRIKTGSVTCQSGTKINGSVYLGAGSFSGSGACEVTGSINVSDYVTINSGASVLGSVSARGTNLSGGYAVSVYGTGTSTSGGRAIVGSVNAGGAVYIAGKIGGSVTSARQPNGATGGASTITPDGNTLISGNLTAAGVLTSWAARCTTGATGWDDAGNACAIKKYPSVTGTVAYNQAGLDAPAAPAMAPWVDFNYVASDWTNRGFTVVVWPSTQCQINNYNVTQAWVTALNSYTTPTLIDATACSGFDFSQSGALNLSLRTDIAFVSNKFDIGKLTANSNNTTQRKLWFIVPDKTVNGVPDCVGDGKIDIKNLTNIGTTVSALAYTPCVISNSAATWSGQMYAKTVNFDTTITLTFKPVGLPNVDFDSGVVTTTTTSSTSGLGNRVSIRDLTG